MASPIKTHMLGKLRIYLTTGESIKSEKLLHKVFPKSTYKHIVEEAKKSGLMNAIVYHTHFGFSNGNNIQQLAVEGDNGGLTICVELIDNREKLEDFFKAHKKMLAGKMVVYKEVEFWDVE